MKITISGTPGSGKSTIGTLLAEKLGFTYYDMGQVRREMAEAKGMSIHELNEVGEEEDWTDKEADKITERIGKTQDNFVFVGRIAYHFIPDSIKIRLTCSIEEGAKRIVNENRAKENYRTVEDAQQQLKERQESDEKRYRKWYNIDMHKAPYDVVIDTTELSIEEVLQQILDVAQ